MLSVLFSEQFDNFRHILEFYLGPEAIILDTTYGHGKLWQNVNRTKTTSNMWIIISNDVDSKSPAKYHYPIEDLHLIAKIHGLFDAVIYDPPYKYDVESYVFFQDPKKDADWQPNKTKWSVLDQVQCAKKLNLSAPQLLKEDGLLIVKIMDTRFKRELILNHKIIMDMLTNFELIDLLIYVRLGVGVFKNANVAQVAHGYYLVFKKKKTLNTADTIS